MKVISVNAGHPHTMEWKGKSFTTAIFKEPVLGPVEIDELGLKTDTQECGAIPPNFSLNP